MTTDYINGIQYDSNVLDFVQAEEGIARRNGTTYSYEYNLKDHLGNTRVTFYKNPTSGSLEVLQRDDYYPFGLQKTIVANTNKYLYNGKEIQEELGQYDYGARFYDPVVGRWNAVDNSAENYEEYSPYVYVGNNPLIRTDVDGNDWGDILRGAVTAIVDNTTGIDRRGNIAYNSANDYNRGQDIGDAVSVVIGALEFGGGATVAAGGVGVTVASGGTLSFAGVPAALGGSAMAAHGAKTGVSAVSNLVNQKGRVNASRSDNKLKPNPGANGDHSSIKRDPSGKTTNTATYKKNPKNPSGFDEVKRVDVTGKPHFDKKTGKSIPTPHVQEPKKPVRPARQDELPNQK